MNIDILHTISEYCSITDYIKILKYIKTNEYILQKLVERYKKDRQRWLLIINDNLISSRKDTHLKKWVEKINTLKYDLHESNIYNIYQFFYYIYQDIKNLQMKCTICIKKTEYNRQVVVFVFYYIQNRVHGRHIYNYVLFFDYI